MRPHPTADAAYPWPQWADGRTWNLKQGVHFKGSKHRMIMNAKDYAAKRGLQCEARSRNQWIIVRFFPSTRLQKASTNATDAAQ